MILTSDTHTQGEFSSCPFSSSSSYIQLTFIGCHGEEEEAKILFSVLKSCVGSKMVMGICDVVMERGLSGRKILFLGGVGGWKCCLVGDENGQRKSIMEIN